MVLGIALLALAASPLVSPQAHARPCPLQAGSKELLAEAARELASSRWEAASELLLCAAEKAEGENDHPRRAKILNNLGVAWLYQQNFQQAYAAFQQAYRLAHDHRLAELEAGAWSNLASLYGMLGAWPAAVEALEQALLLMPARSRHRASVLAQRLRLAARRPNLAQAEFFRLWGEAMESAEQLQDWQVQRHLWDELFKHHLEGGRLGAAEAALANSFRVVTLQRLPDTESLWMLAGQLRLAQGRPAEALAWLRRIGEQRTSRQNPVNALRLAAAEARAIAALHGPDAALAACRGSWPRVWQWRHAVLPDPAVELAADVAMTELVNEYVQAALESGGSRGSEVEAWAAVEQSRALGMLRRRKLRQTADPAAGAARTISRRDGALPAVEAGRQAQPTQTVFFLEPVHSPGPAPFRNPRQLLRMVQDRLDARQALFTLWLGPRFSLLWVVTNQSIAAARLPERDVLVAAFRQFRQEVERGSDAGSLASRIYGMTLGQLSAAAGARSEWLISADDEPLVAPLAALREAGEPVQPLASSRALSLLPSALWLLEPQRRQPPRKLLAVGGLIQNSADPRWRSSGLSPMPASPPVSSDSRSGGGAPAPELELPTLPGSAREIESVAAMWARHGLTANRLTGFEGTRASLESSMREEWTDFHFATHVQPAPAPLSYRFSLEPGSALPVVVRFPAGEPFLALTLRTDGIRDGLTGKDVERLRVEGARVVLNGCSTGEGPAQRGAGVSSFAHAWLAAGASSVIASLWPVDDDGAFFEAYYSALLRGHRPAVALQAAQIAMIRSGTWRAHPRYWAAYIHLGKD